MLARVIWQVLETYWTRLSRRSLVCFGLLVRLFHIHTWSHRVRDHHDGRRLFLLGRWLVIVVPSFKLLRQLLALVLVAALPVDALARLGAVWGPATDDVSEGGSTDL